MENSSGKSSSYTATTVHGLEEVLSKELTALGAQDVKAVKRAVTFSGDKALLYKANLHLRTALRILKPIHTFKVRTANELYYAVQQINWQDHMGPKDTLAIDAAIFSEFFTHTKFPALKAKDAIVDQFREQTGRRPSVDTQKPDLRIHLRIFQDQGILSLDSSGAPLNQRGYRTAINEAPLNEVLAAGMLALAGYKGDKAFVDPMCGSGTLLIEAAMLAANKAPGLLREHFNFQNWPDYDRGIWRDLRNEANRAVKPIEVPILGGDRSPLSGRVAVRNLEAAGLEEFVDIKVTPFEKLKAPAEKGLMVMNPPYGERLELEEGDRFYRGIGDALKAGWNGWEAWIITSNQSSLRKIGMKPGAGMKYSLLNGKLDCWYRGYQIF